MPVITPSETQRQCQFRVGALPKLSQRTNSLLMVYLAAHQHYHMANEITSCLSLTFVSVLHTKLIKMSSNLFFVMNEQKTKKEFIMVVIETLAASRFSFSLPLLAIMLECVSDRGSRSQKGDYQYQYLWNRQNLDSHCNGLL